MCSQKKNKLEYRIRCVWQRKFHRKLVTNWPIHNLSIDEGNQTLLAILYDDNQDPGFNKKKRKDGHGYMTDSLITNFTTQHMAMVNRSSDDNRCL